MDISTEIEALRREVTALAGKRSDRPHPDKAPGVSTEADGAPQGTRLADSAGGDVELLAGLDAVLGKIGGDPQTALLGAFAVGLSIGLALAWRVHGLRA